MKINITEQLKDAIESVRFSGTKGSQIARVMDLVTLVLFYVGIICSAIAKEFEWCLMFFIAVTLWKISIVLVRILSQLNAAITISISDKIEKEE